jgi:molybdenum cofactor biosynthesis enzyme MoaA
MNLIYNLIKMNRMIRTHRIKFVGVLFCHLLGLRHLFLRIDPVNSCNLKCLMCRSYGDDTYRIKHTGSLSPAQLQRIAHILFHRALYISYGCIAEPTLYEDLSGLVRLAKDYKIPFVSVVTNGQLLTETMLRKLLANRLNELILSIHGAKKHTYERFMAGASFERLHALLETIMKLRQLGLFKKCKVRINYVVNSENLEELAYLFDVFGKCNFNILQIRPMIACNFKDQQGLSHDTRYQTVLQGIRQQCIKRDILLLAEDTFMANENENYDSLILPAIYRYISPEVVWRNDFDWQTETYEHYCRKKHYTGYILKKIFTKKKVLIRSIHPEFLHSLKYSIR